MNSPATVAASTVTAHVAATTTPAPGKNEAGEGFGLAVIVGGFVLWAIGYWISLRVHPYRACRACKGAARNRGKIYTYAFGPCRACKGTGRHLRLGSRLFSGDRT